MNVKILLDFFTKEAYVNYISIKEFSYMSAVKMTNNAYYFYFQGFYFYPGFLRCNESSPVTC